MKEYRFIFSIITAISTGLFWFTQKIQAENKNKSNNSFIFYVYFYYLIFSLLLILLLGMSGKVTSAKK